MNQAKGRERHELWRQRVAQQKASGQTVRAFCREHGWNEHSFYSWRKQLQGSAKDHLPVRFALVETNQPVRPLELVLRSGDRLHIPVDAATLRLVLSVLQQS
jgi:transposase-like protein